MPPTPTRRERFKALVDLGIRPEDALRIIGQADQLDGPVDDVYLASLAGAHPDDAHHAAVTIAYSPVVDDQWRGLWDAVPLPLA